MSLPTIAGVLENAPDWCAPVLRAFALKHGKGWRVKLDDLYYSGQDAYVRLDGFPHAGSVLRQVRNHPQRDVILGYALR